MSIELALALSRIGRPRVLVVGDALYDADCHCSVNRFAQESHGVPVWECELREGRPGGAMAVVAMACGLGASCIPFCSAKQVATKYRYFVDGRMVGRFDVPAIGPFDINLSALSDAIANADCVLIADYGKGACTDAVLRAAIDGAKARGIPCIADPHEHEWYRYEGATCLKQNSKQARAQPRPLEACVTFPAIVITRGPEGIGLCTHTSHDEEYPTRPRQVVDVTGAGDMVLAALGFCVSRLLSWSDACKVANAAAGLKVERRGAVPVPRCEVIADLLDGHTVVPSELLPAVSEACRARGGKVVWTNGCMDSFHSGHLHMLSEARKQGDLLIVGVNTDESVNYLKGQGRPLRRWDERSAVVAALGCVDYVVQIGSQGDLQHCIEAVKPDVLVVGSDYRGKPIVGAEHAGRIHYVERIPGVSTSEIIRCSTPRASLLPSPP